MTTTEHELGPRLRRELAELATVPASRERQAPATTAGARHPLTTAAIAILVVTALVVASFAIAKSADHRRDPSARPRVYTLLQPPAALTGSKLSIAAKPRSQVCRSWRVLSTGLDCRFLQARYVWQPTPAGQYRFLAIEVVGTPDPTFTRSGPAYTGPAAQPIDERVDIRGHVARVYGTDLGVSAVWQERPDLQIDLNAGPTSESPGAERLRDVVVRAALGMRPVAVDPDLTNFVVRHGVMRAAYSRPTGFISVPWSLTWNPGRRRLCAQAGALQCITAPTNGSSLVARSLTGIGSCAAPLVQNQGIVWGILPTRAATVEVRASSERPVSGGSLNRFAFVPRVLGASMPKVFVVVLRASVDVTAAAFAAHRVALTHPRQHVADFAPSCP